MCEFMLLLNGPPYLRVGSMCKKYSEAIQWILKGRVWFWLTHPTGTKKFENTKKDSHLGIFERTTAFFEL